MINREVGDVKSNLTKRNTVPAVEELLYDQIKVLDHGFIRVIDYMGDDSAVVQAARVSYGKGTKKVTQDQGLINYLMRNSHTTPFEMCEIKFHIKLPIFVARQWIRHRTASVNEYSARYSILSKEFYLPRVTDIAAQSSVNRQGRDDNSVSEEVAVRILETLKGDANRCYDHYMEMLNEKEDGSVLDSNAVGISRELARMNLTVNFYTEWYWKVNFHNLMHFLKLRSDKHAQYEIRVYAEEILKIIEKWMPLSFAAFAEYKLHGASISRTALTVIRRMIRGEKVNLESSNLNLREWNELMNLLEKN